MSLEVIVLKKVFIDFDFQFNDIFFCHLLSILQFFKVFFYNNINNILHIK